MMFATVMYKDDELPFVMNMPSKKAFDNLINWDYIKGIEPDFREIQWATLMSDNGMPLKRYVEGSEYRNEED